MPLIRNLRWTREGYLPYQEVNVFRLGSWGERQLFICANRSDSKCLGLQGQIQAASKSLSSRRTLEAGRAPGNLSSIGARLFAMKGQNASNWSQIFASL